MLYDLIYTGEKREDIANKIADEYPAAKLAWDYDAVHEYRLEVTIELPQFDWFKVLRSLNVITLSMEFQFFMMSSTEAQRAALIDHLK